MFKLVSEYKPSGDQPNAIKVLSEGIKEGKKHQTLLGATGTGKTYTIANVIQEVQKPTLVMVHNKTLAGQLYAEFKELFPENRVEYFVSNFDFYQPEAYLPKSDTYIDKNATTNEELDMLRMAAVNSILERRDTIIVASVACIYGASNPEHYREMFFTLRVNDVIDRKELLLKFVARQYTRNDMDLTRGTFRVRGESIEVAFGHSDSCILRIEMFDNTIERILEVDKLTGRIINSYKLYVIYPASGYSTSKERTLLAAKGIEDELNERLIELKQDNKLLEYQRLEQRTTYDVEALREFGVCPGIENYSRHMDGRQPGDRPYTLLDYFPEDFLMVVDESHVSLPQIRGMYNGDRARKEVLVNYGFRLPSALDNRPLKYEEFEKLINQIVYVSATPGNYELEKCHDKYVEQIIRPTGLVDPTVEVKPTMGQIDDLLENIMDRISKNERVLVTALTVRMAEELTNYLKAKDLKVAWLHHEVKTIERTEIIHDLRIGKYDVLIGINLLREGLDIPEVSLIAILDADKEGFLRSERSLVQIIGRAARNVSGHVIMYADKITYSMQKALDETNRRRKIQQEYNKLNGIIPTTIKKEVREVITSKETLDIVKEMSGKKKIKAKDKEKVYKELEKEMKDAARELDFERAAQLRDMLLELKE